MNSIGRSPTDVAGSILTFPDSGVLIAGGMGGGEPALAALEVLDDPGREFCSSVFVRLDVLPKPVCYGLEAEADFYRDFFDAVEKWATLDEKLLRDAERLACKYGLGAMDALHVAAAVSLSGSELVPTEGPAKPIHRVTEVTVRSIRPSTLT